jgi:hypothetical protein
MTIREKSKHSIDNLALYLADKADTNKNVVTAPAYAT